MNISADYSMAVKFKEFILNKKYVSKEKCSQFVNSLDCNESFKKMLQFYENLFSIDQYIDILYKSLNQKPFETDDEALRLMYNNFKRIIGSEDLIIKKIELIGNYNFNKLQHTLADTLPKNTDIDINIHFVFDGINGGSMVDEKNMLIYTMFWPSKKENVDLIKWVLLHEYHHLGLKYWIDRDHIRKEVYSRKDNIKLALTLSDSILAEGAATYFFNESQDLYSLLLESHGEEYAEKYKQSMVNRDVNIEKTMSELERDFEKLLSDENSYESMKKTVNDYFYSFEGKEPKDKALGYHMCDVIEKVYSRGELIDCFLKPGEFIRKYNEAAKQSNNFVFSEEVVRNLMISFEDKHIS
ncbi:MAG: hypothetical protein FH761_07475 [Firmicutes bacterium]|nr:hypothetical protein [Bacillota bacterium]